jgi:hypothetical protein
MGYWGNRYRSKVHDDFLRGFLRMLPLQLKNI